MLLLFTDALLFSTRLVSAAENAGYSITLFESLNDIIPEGTPIFPDQHGEALNGRDGIFLDKITSLTPALIVFDLDTTTFPWSTWISLLKSAPATRRIPVIAFGSHKEVEAFQRAKNAGADAVVARSKITADFPSLIRKHGIFTDITAIHEGCHEQLSEFAKQGIDLFNNGEYFEAHECLEDAWHEEVGISREFYRAMVQIAVAYLQIQRGNYRGAVKMFLRMRQWLAPLPDACRGINIAQLRLDLSIVEDTLKTLGPDKITNFPPNLLKPFPIIG